MSDARNIVSVDPLGSLLPDLGEAACAIGVFDGLHVGHRSIIARACEEAAAIGATPVVVTFDIDPDEIFRKDDAAFGKLLSNEERLAMLADLVPGVVASVAVTPEVLAMPPESFLEFLGAIMHPRAICTGADFRFGAKAAGSVEDLARWAAQHGCAHVACELVEEDGIVVSSTRIREELRQGRVVQAKRLLAGRPHGIAGTVVHGRGQGDGFGFATANLDLSRCEVMLPREGVYGGFGIVEGTRYPAAVNVGVARSFEDATAQVEAHLLDFDGDLYGKEVRVEFEEWLREPRRFESKDELVSTVMDNIDWVRENMKVR